jgi:hypothetical protein
MRMPTIQLWDGKASGLTAETFLRDVFWHARDNEANALQLLPRALAVGPRANWEAVCKRYEGKGQVMSWVDAQREFKVMVGDDYVRTEEEATCAFIDGRVKMGAGQSVAQYRTSFEEKLRLAPTITEALAVQYFVRGLEPKLAKHCQGDATGRMFTSLDAAFNYAVMAERIERTPTTSVSTDAKAVAVLSDGSHAKQGGRGGRGGRGFIGGRGGGRGRGRAHFNNTYTGHVQKFNGRGGFAGGRGHGAGRGGASGGRMGGGGAGGNWPRPKCFICGRVGHKAAACYDNPNNQGQGGAGAGANAVM